MRDEKDCIFPVFIVFYKVRTLLSHTNGETTGMKHIKEIAVILAFVIAGVAFSQQAQEGSKKSAASSKKSECCSKMKSKGEGKMGCCASDSTCTKDEKSGGEKH
jgi:hypothetical protein